MASEDDHETVTTTSIGPDRLTGETREGHGTTLLVENRSARALALERVPEDQPERKRIHDFFGEMFRRPEYLTNALAKRWLVEAEGADSLVLRSTVLRRCADEVEAAHPDWTEFSDEPGGMPEERGDMLLQVRWRRDAEVTIGAPQTRYFRFADGEWWSEKCNGCNSAHLGLVCRGEEWLFVPLPGGGS